MQDPIRSITLPTIDHGDVTIPEPSWCAGHAHHDPQAVRDDLVHVGPMQLLIVDEWRLGIAFLFYAPYSGQQQPRAAVHLDYGSGHAGLIPADLYALAAAMDGGADKVRALADQLAAILAGGAR
ncbi:DUF6907 domain-containing protein [Streptomyces chartreusis]|uniref:DUF6907 domain-containing protein n=1 Tax=Streptomyces chartreusis TaxID=1969 RepID=UPI003408C9FD